MTKKVPLNVYGISVYHPDNWQIFINPNNKFTFNEGLIKVDKVKGTKKAEASLSIRWAKMLQDITLDEYVEELEKQFERKQKRSRNKDQYRINSKSKLTLIDGTDAYLLENEFVANHSIYRILGKDELIKVLQVMFYSPESKRMVVASLSTASESLEKYRADFMDILSTLHEDLQTTGHHQQTPLESAY
ncbi:hypothetical protein ACFSCZ_15605 [Siminovitchia sediminis]|uniref:Uncharacterized protein n=1 Tax=Siminovitchia sediminis TaxID=1274353 RepID=A0ABW4KPH8_9BACI